MKKFLILSAAITFLTCASAEENIYVVTNGHAHNDYEHEEPLIGALKAGFVSVEVDIHFINNSLFVIHDAPESTEGIPTLTELYLEPLANWIDENDGEVYPGFDDFFYLMIDLKTSGEETYPVLRQELLKYEHIISKADDEFKKPVKVFISGNRPIETILQDSTQIASIDGRPENLQHGFSSEIMPVISQNYNKYLSWRGAGEVDERERSWLKEMIDEAHGEGKLVRLWAAPDIPEVWEFLLSIGVDWINTDKIGEFREFSLERSQFN